jgi:hypothetical protein
VGQDDPHPTVPPELTGQLDPVVGAEPHDAAGRWLLAASAGDQQEGEDRGRRQAAHLLLPALPAGFLEELLVFLLPHLLSTLLDQ